MNNENIYYIDLRGANNVTVNIDSNSKVINPLGTISKMETPVTRVEASNKNEYFTDSFFNTAFTNSTKVISQAKNVVVYVAKNTLKIINNWGAKIIEWNELILLAKNIDNVKQISHHLFKFIDHIKP